MTHIAAVHGVLPPNHYTQREITDAFGRQLLDHRRRSLLEQLHSSVRVQTRHLALKLDEYERLEGFGAANNAFITVGLDLGERAIRGALDAAGIMAHDIDFILTTSVTGIAAPSIEARLADRVGLRPDVKRVPVFGLGCVAGAAGIARLHDYLLAYPDQVAVLLSVELCSLTVQKNDSSIANLVASGLFGDGAAAVVAVGDHRAARLGRDPAGPAVVDTRSRLYPNSERVMGWDIGGNGFRIVLANNVADVVRMYLGDDVAEFLIDHHLKMDDVECWVAHPGGPKVITAMEEVFGLRDGELGVTWRSLAAVGNLSSASVLHVLAETISRHRPRPGAPGLMLAMGPGFCSELVLLRW